MTSRNLWYCLPLLTTGKRFCTNILLYIYIYIYVVTKNLTPSNAWPWRHYFLTILNVYLLVSQCKHLVSSKYSLIGKVRLRKNTYFTRIFIQVLRFIYVNNNRSIICFALELQEYCSTRYLTWLNKYLVLESILPNFFLRKQRIFPLSLLN